MKRYYDKKFFVISLWYWRVEVAFAVNMDKNEVLRKFKRISDRPDVIECLEQELNGWDTTSKVTRGRMISLPSGYLVLLNFKKDNFRNDMGTLVHEVSHVIHYMLRERRVPLIEETEEAYTYGIEHLTVEAMKALYD